MIELSVEEVIDSFYDNRREYYKKFISSAFLYKDRIEVSYMNGRTFTIPKPLRHNHRIENVVITTGNRLKPFEFSFEYDFHNMAFTVREVDSVEETREFVKRDYQRLLDKALISCQTQENGPSQPF